MDSFLFVIFNKIRFYFSFRVLFTGVVPMGWIVNNKMLGAYGGNWPHSKCLTWYYEDKRDMRWLKHLEYCPCNLQQALSDFGRWQTDVGCNLYSDNPHKCRFHLGAVHCVRAVQPSRYGYINTYVGLSLYSLIWILSIVHYTTYSLKLRIGRRWFNVSFSNWCLCTTRIHHIPKYIL